jgi:hypothetical protein
MLRGKGLGEISLKVLVDTSQIVPGRFPVFEIHNVNFSCWSLSVTRKKRSNLCASMSCIVFDKL